VKRCRCPACRDADPGKWGVACCTVDGQVFAHGDVDDYFSIQSTSKPVTYGMALAERGEDFVHSYIGGQPLCLPLPVTHVFAWPSFPAAYHPAGFHLAQWQAQ
jgi:glutaminase